MRMEVDTEHLNAGADRCGYGATTASTAADELEGKQPAAGMFGDFAEAHAFHSAVEASHQAQVQQLRDHHSALSDIGDKSRSGAQAFTARDADSADSLRGVEAGFSET